MFDTEATFVTHVRVDSIDRINNLQIILNFYSHFFPKSKFILVEDGPYHDKQLDKLIYPTSSAFYFLQHSGIFHKTKCLNYGMFKAKTSHVVALDTDCIVNPNALQSCFDEISSQQATIAWPYNGYFIDTARSFIDPKIKKTTNLYEACYKEFIKVEAPIVGLTTPIFSVRCSPESHRSNGGIVVFNSNVFRDLGGYNEKFIGWGAEDDEIETRYNTFIQPMYRHLDSICFHINHQAVRHGNPFYKHNCLESDKVGMMSLNELQDYISTWDWIPKK